MTGFWQQVVTEVVTCDDSKWWRWWQMMAACGMLRQQEVQNKLQSEQVNEQTKTRNVETRNVFWAYIITKKLMLIILWYLSTGNTQVLCWGGGWWGDAGGGGMIGLWFSPQSSDEFALSPPPTRSEAFTRAGRPMRFAVYDLPTFTAGDGALNLAARSSVGLRYDPDRPPALHVHRFQTGERRRGGVPLLQLNSISDSTPTPTAVPDPWGNSIPIPIPIPMMAIPLNSVIHLDGVLYRVIVIIHIGIFC